MTAVLLTPPVLQFFGSDGVTPLASGKVYTYSAGTTTPKATYTTAAATVEAANPVILDSVGKATIWISGSYKFVVKDSLDNTISTTDSVTAFTALAASSTSYFQSFSGTGAQTAFTTSLDLGTDEKAIYVWVDAGAGKGYEIQNPSAYTISATTLTFSSAPASGTNNIYVSAPSTLVGAASSSAAAAAASETAATASALLASQWATLTSGLVAATDNSAKAYAIGGTGVTTTSGKGAAKEWATSTGAAVDTSEYSAKEYATGTTVAVGSAKQWATKLSTAVNGSDFSAKYNANLAAASAVDSAASAVTASVYAAALSSTSTSSLLIATGAKTFTTQAGKQYAAGQFVIASSDANNANYMHGTVTSYSSTTLILNVTDVGGSGTLADWTISVSGTQGATGATGAAGSISDLTGVATATAATGDYLVFQDISASDVTKKDTIANILALASSGGVLNNGYNTNRYYSGGYLFPSTGTEAVAADTLYGTPFYVGATTTFTRMGISVTATGTATAARLGIYNLVGGVPTTLVLDCGTVSVSGTGLKEVTISQSLTPGIYVLASVYNGTCTLTSFVTVYQITGNIWGAVDIAGDAISTVTAAHAYAALPTPYPSVTFVASGAKFELKWLRKV